MSTKTYSTAQEKLIANTLCWQIVPASGARNFHPGDIKSPSWLGECKTHQSEVDKIQFNRNVWDKIYSEAFTEHKSAALFVDNGTQTLVGTYVMFNMNENKKDFEYFLVTSENHDEYSNIVKGSANISFNYFDMRSFHRKVKSTVASAAIERMIVYDGSKFGKGVVFTPFSEFHCFFGGII